MCVTGGGGGGLCVTYDVILTRWFVLLEDSLLIKQGVLENLWGHRSNVVPSPMSADTDVI